MPSSGDTVSSLVIVSNETAVSSWTVERGGELRLGADVTDPLVRWTFDDAAQPGADTGSLGKSFNFSACMTATNDAERGHCVYFDGAGQVWVSTAAGLPSDTAFTIAGWMKSEYQNSGLLYWGANASVKSGGFGLQDGKPTFYFYGGGDLQAPASAMYYDSMTWTHFAAVYEPSAASGRKMRVYVNGTQVAAMDPTRTVAIDTTAELRLGTCTMNETRFNKGFVDDVMIFGRALTDAEITILSNTSDARDFLPQAASVSVAGGGVVSVGIGSQTFGGLSGGGTLQVDEISEARFSSESSQSIGEIEGEGRAVVASGTLEAGLADTFAEHTVLHYTFEDPANPGADTGSAGLHLKASTASADAAWADVTDSAVPGAMHFDGAHCLIPTAAADANVTRLPSGNSAYTIAVRLTLDVAGGRDGISSWGVNSGQQKNGLRFYNSRENVSGSSFGLMSYQWGADTPAPLDGVSSSLPGGPAGGWHTVVVTYDPGTSTKTFYLDGARVMSATLPALNVSASRFTIGRAEGSGYDYYRGYIDDYRVLNCAVTADEARALVAEVSAVARETALAVDGGATLSVPAGKAFSTGTLAAEGTVSVAGRLNVTKGASEINGALSGNGVVATASGAQLAISGAKSFAGTAKVENGTLAGAWAMPSATVSLGAGGGLAASGGVCSAGGITLVEGGFADLGTLAPGGAYWTSATPIALPGTFTIRVTASARPIDTRMIFAAPSVSGSVENWTLDATGFRIGYETSLRQTSNGVELVVKSPATVLYVR